MNFNKPPRTQKKETAGYKPFDLDGLHKVDANPEGAANDNAEPSPVAERITFDPTSWGATGENPLEAAKKASEAAKAKFAEVMARAKKQIPDAPAAHPAPRSALFENGLGEKYAVKDSGPRFEDAPPEIPKKVEFLEEGLGQPYTPKNLGPKLESVGTANKDEAENILHAPTEKDELLKKLAQETPEDFTKAIGSAKEQITTEEAAEEAAAKTYFDKVKILKSNKSSIWTKGYGAHDKAQKEVNAAKEVYDQRRLEKKRALSSIIRNQLTEKMSGSDWDTKLRAKYDKLLTPKEGGKGIEKRADGTPISFDEYKAQFAERVISREQKYAQFYEVIKPAAMRKHEAQLERLSTEKKGIFKKTMGWIHRQQKKVEDGIAGTLVGKKIFGREINEEWAKRLGKLGARSALLLGTATAIAVPIGSVGALLGASGLAVGGAALGTRLAGGLKSIFLGTGAGLLVGKAYKDLKIGGKTFAERDASRLENAKDKSIESKDDLRKYDKAYESGTPEAIARKREQLELLATTVVTLGTSLEHLAELADPNLSSVHHAASTVNEIKGAATEHHAAAVDHTQEALRHEKATALPHHLHHTTHGAAHHGTEAATTVAPTPSPEAHVLTPDERMDLYNKWQAGKMEWQHGVAPVEHAGNDTSLSQNMLDDLKAHGVNADSPYMQGHVAPVVTHDVVPTSNAATPLAHEAPSTEHYDAPDPREFVSSLPKPEHVSAPAADTSSAHVDTAPTPPHIEAPQAHEFITNHNGVSIDKKVPHLYTMPSDSPSKPDLAMFGNHTGKKFLELVQAEAMKHPGQKIFFDSPTPTMINGTPQPWINYALYDPKTGILLPGTPDPQYPSFVGGKLDTESFTKVVE